jgi:predicted phage tail protein
MLRTIHFDGVLQKLTNIKTIQLDVDSPQSLLNGLRSQVKNFREALIAHPQLCIISASKDMSSVSSISAETFAFPLSDEQDDIYVLTPIKGAGSGAEVWLASELMAAFDIATATATMIASVAVMVAVNIAVSVVVQALSPSASTADGGAAADQRPSFLFNGAVNVIEQGYAVPLVYGTHLVGSIVVSTGVDVAELPYETTQATPPSNGGGTAQPAVPDVPTWWDMNGGYG